MYKCKYCGKEFGSKTKLGGHVTFCKSNPNYIKNLLKLNDARTHIDYKNFKKIKFKCPYCNKICGNRGALIRHINSCYKNPNVEISNSRRLRLEQQYRKEHNIKFWKGKKLTEEHKQKIREGYYRWMNQHRDEFLNYSRGQSKACEHFKDILRKNNISFIEEYAPYWKERGFRLDIAFPNEKIGIEINGTQHYNSNGELNEESVEKQKFFEDRGWKIIQVYYQDSYKERPNCLNDILKLPIRDKNYIQKDFDIRLKKQEELLIKKQQHLQKLIEIKNRYIELFEDLINNSGIDFSKFGWSGLAKKYLISKGYNLNNSLYEKLKKYCPEFLERSDVYKRINSNQGMCWITKDGKNLKIKKDKLKEYIDLGWIKGRIM